VPGHPEQFQKRVDAYYEDQTPIYVTENREATDAAYGRLISFLGDDATEQGVYEPGHECSSFAVELHDHAERCSIKAHLVLVSLSNAPLHMIVGFNTTDRGMIYVDDTGLTATESGTLPGGETLPVGQHLSVGPDRDVLIETVTLTSEYTEVRYALPDALAGAGWPHAEVELVLQAGGLTLRGYGVRDLSANGSPEPERTEYFPPLAAVSAFRIVARVHPPADQSRFVYRFEDTGAISEWHRTTTGLVVTVAGIRTMAPAGGFVTDTAGGQYAVDFDCVTLVEGRLRRTVRVEGFPTDARPVTLTLVEGSGAEAQPGGAIELPVRDGSSR
jgi:hypothetical protein